MGLQSLNRFADILYTNKDQITCQLEEALYITKGNKARVGLKRGFSKEFFVENAHLCTQARPRLFAWLLV